MSARPDLFHVEIVGPMSPRTVSDDFANSKKKKTDVGYYYKNVGEDDGSISAVVPDKSWLKVESFASFINR